MIRVLKKIFRKKKKEEPKQECWYNNYHERTRSEWAPADECGAVGSPNSYLYATAQQAAKHQG